MKRWIIPASLALFLAYSTAQAKRCAVNKYIFCEIIEDHKAKNIFRETATPIIGSPIYLWIELRITADGLRYLQSYGKLPIYVSWGRDGAIFSTKHNIGISNQHWTRQKDAIESEFANSIDGSFTWRTWVMLSDLEIGEYFASILDVENQPLPLYNKATACRPRLKVTGFITGRSM